MGRKTSAKWRERKKEKSNRWWTLISTLSKERNKPKEFDLVIKFRLQGGGSPKSRQSPPISFFEVWKNPSEKEEEEEGKAHFGLVSDQYYCDYSSHLPFLTNRPFIPYSSPLLYVYSPPLFFDYVSAKTKYRYRHPFLADGIDILNGTAPDGLFFNSPRPLCVCLFLDFSMSRSSFHNQLR